MRDWDDEFANMAHVEGSEKLLGIWAEQAAAYRKKNSSITQITYGSESREYFDLVLPQGTPKGLVVFVHGGYWIRLSPADWTQLAEGACARGWAVALPGYTLAPDASITHITHQITKAIAHAADQVSGPIVITGHSAGGHLAARMMCSDTALPKAVLNRVRHTVPISGVFDLRPLMWTAMNDLLKLDEAEAVSASPVLSRPYIDAGEGPRVTFWVGAAERPEFVRQNRLMSSMWEGLGAMVSQFEDPGMNHFTVVDALRDPDSALVNTLLE